MSLDMRPFPPRQVRWTAGGTYIGHDNDLKGERAMIRVERRPFMVGAQAMPTHLGCVYVAWAQFDRHETGLGYFWLPYPIADFAMDDDL